MKFALILIAIALTAAVGFSWVPVAKTQVLLEDVHPMQDVKDPLRDAVPVEHIEFEPFHINVQYVSAQAYPAPIKLN